MPAYRLDLRLDQKLIHTTTAKLLTIEMFQYFINTLKK